MNATTVCNREYPYAFYVAESPYAYGESLYAYWDSFFGQPSSLERVMHCSHHSPPSFLALSTNRSRCLSSFSPPPSCPCHHSPLCRQLETTAALPRPRADPCHRLVILLHSNDDASHRLPPPSCRVDHPLPVEPLVSGDRQTVSYQPHIHANTIRSSSREQHRCSICYHQYCSSSYTKD